MEIETLSRASEVKFLEDWTGPLMALRGPEDNMCRLLGTVSGTTNIYCQDVTEITAFNDPPVFVSK